jgi:DNA-binding transcriptional LysR family regulator
MIIENGLALRPLDLDAVQAFVLIADLASFTRAAEALDTTQSAVSLKLKRLEGRLGRRLLERTPRRVRLSAEGMNFLDAARELLSAHERALSSHVTARISLRIGIGDQAGGTQLPTLLAKVGAYDRSLQLEVRIGSSRSLLAAYDSNELDAVIVCRDTERPDGETLFIEPHHWYAVSGWEQSPGEPLRLASLASPCTVRGLALKALEEAGIAWSEVFVGGGIPAVSAAVSAGLAVSPLTRRTCPPSAVDVGARLGLPEIPPIEIALYTRTTDPRTREAIRILVAALRATTSS